MQIFEKHQISVIVSLLSCIAQIKATRFLRWQQKLNITNNIYSVFFENGCNDLEYNFKLNPYDFVMLNNNDFDILNKDSEKKNFGKTFYTNSKNLQKKGKDLFCSMFNQKIKVCFTNSNMMSRTYKDAIFIYLYQNIIEIVSKELTIYDSSIEKFIKENPYKELDKKFSKFEEITNQKFIIKKVGVLLSALIHSYNFQNGINNPFTEKEFNEFVNLNNLNYDNIKHTLYTYDGIPYTDYTQSTTVSVISENQNLADLRKLINKYNCHIQKVLIDSIVDLIKNTFQKTGKVMSYHNDLIAPCVNKMYKRFYFNQECFTFDSFIDSVEEECILKRKKEKSKQQPEGFEKDFDFIVAKNILLLQLFITVISSKSNAVEYVYVNQKHSQLAEYLLLGFKGHGTYEYVTRKEINDQIEQNTLSITEKRNLDQIFEKMAISIQNSTATLVPGTKEALYFWLNYGYCTASKAEKEGTMRYMQCYTSFQLPKRTLSRLFVQYVCINSSMDESLSFLKNKYIS